MDEQDKALNLWQKPRKDSVDEECQPYRSITDQDALVWLRVVVWISQDRHALDKAAAEEERCYRGSLPADYRHPTCNITEEFGT